MKINIFQSDKGDCLLLTSSDGRRRILVDGGMRGSYTQHVAPTLNRLQRAGKRIDVVYVSHIDQDHISGVLQLMDDLADWRVYDFQKRINHPGRRRPETKRPPEVGAIWHNAFHEQVGDNAGRVEDLLAAHERVLCGLKREELSELAQSFSDLVTSKREAVLLSRRVSDRQLRIPLNRPADGRLMTVRRSGNWFRVGSMRITIIGPFPEDLAKLRSEWNRWLEDNEPALRSIRTRARREEGRLRGTETEELDDRLTQEAQALNNLLLSRGERLGRRNLVTTPNLASLMVLVEERGKSIILTGDGHHADILKGLDRNSELDRNGRIHVDVLKVQHHGSEHNIDLEFCQRVTADHYIFCGNGAHENPDEGAVEAILDARLGPEGTRTGNPHARTRPFTLWFNSSYGVTDNKLAHRRHMRKIERLVQRRARTTDQMHYRFMRGNRSRMELEV